MNKKKWLIPILSLLGICTLAVIIGLVRYVRAFVEDGFGPEVSILSPLLGDQVNMNHKTPIHAIASSSDGVTGVELWIDDKPMLVKTSQLSGGSTPFPIFIGWQPDVQGTHVIVVRALDRKGRSGQSSVIVEALDSPPSVSFVIHQLQEGETLDSFPVISPSMLEVIEEHHPELTSDMQRGEVALVPLTEDDTEEEAMPLEEESLESLDESPLVEVPSERIPGWLSYLGSGLTPLELEGTILHVEGLSLGVDKEYDGVFCYLSLASSDVERVPAEGYLEGRGGRTWSIEDAIGGINRRTVFLREGVDQLVVMVNCLGYRETLDGGILYNLGRLDTVHFEGDWDGRRLEHWINGPDGWFRVTYRIIRSTILTEEEGVLPAPLGLSKRCFENNFLNIVTCVLSWYYPEEYKEQIDGYLAVQNDGLFLDLKRGLPAFEQDELVLLEGVGVPSCGERYEYHLIAYQGDPMVGDRSNPSNAIVLEGETCPTISARVTLETLNTVCLTGDCVQNPFELDLEGRWINPEGPLDEDGCNRGKGCEGESYATISINEKRVYLGGMNDFGILYNWKCGDVYSIDEMSSPVWGENPVLVELSPYESLEIGMRLYDYDSHSADDLQCGGGHVFTPDDLLAVQATPENKMTFLRVYDEGGGGCYLVFTIEILPQFQAEFPPPPSIERDG